MYATWRGRRSISSEIFASSVRPVFSSSITLSRGGAVGGARFGQLGERGLAGVVGDRLLEPLHVRVGLLRAAADDVVLRLDVVGGRTMMNRLRSACDTSVFTALTSPAPHLDLHVVVIHHAGELAFDRDEVGKAQQRRRHGHQCGHRRKTEGQAGLDLQVVEFHGGESLRERSSDDFRHPGGWT